MYTYQIFTDATSDLSTELLANLPSVEVIPMQLEIGGCEYTYGPSGDISVTEFYALQREGCFARTSQINPVIYFLYFESYLRQGIDIIYLGFTSGMSGTIQTAQLCMEKLRAEYPERNIICIDTLCASAGEGFLVREAARMQAEGLSIHELANWVTKNRLNVCHWFTVNTFDHLRHGGRVSASAAVMGSILQIKPLLHVDEQGTLQVVAKPRGRKRAIMLKMEKMEQEWRPELGRLVIIAHGDCPEGAEQLTQEIISRFPDAELCSVDIGPIIGAHTGPGMLAVIYWGDTR